MSPKWIFTLIIGVTTVLLPQAQAQTAKKTGATLTGTVLGADGKPVPNASVTCETSSGLHPRAAHTDSKGTYFITGLKQDSYDLRATANGAYSDWVRNIPLRHDQTKSVTLQLLNGNTSVGGTPANPRKP
jgi:hypothetical protein